MDYLLPLSIPVGYEIINLTEVGVDESSVVRTARSGRATLAYRAKLVGYELTKLQLDTV